MNKNLLLYLIFLGASILSLSAKTNRFRVMWRSAPATSMVIGWDQISGSNPTLHFGVIDYGQKVDLYQKNQKPDRVIKAKGMNNHFVRLSGLRPNTIYYFVIKDSEGVSKRLSFRTAPADAFHPLSVVAGGDSRNHRSARQKANKLVGALRPHCIMFSGDMTTNDTALEWIEWFDDWQMTISKDGRIHPIIVARGNHEADNKGLNDLFDVGKPGLYYSLNLGGSLLKITTLNTMAPINGDQKVWLENELAKSKGNTWKFVQYHNSMRPHNANKKERSDLIYHWATLFYKYGVDVAVESDAHCVKWTYPIKPSRTSNSTEGFIRDPNGTIFIGEGGWGAPLREANDKKPWTRDSDSFNQFKWILINEGEIAIRTLKTDLFSSVTPLNDENFTEISPSIRQILWKPRNGSVIIKKNPKFSGPAILPNAQKTNTGSNQQPSSSTAVLRPDPVTKKINLEYSLKQRGNIEIILVNAAMNPVARFPLENQYPGLHQQSIDFSKIRPGKYKLIIKGEKDVIKKFDVEL